MQAAAVAVIIAVVLSLVGEIDAPARDRAQVRAFLRAQGLERTPEGYEVDHIIPLCAGGAESRMPLWPWRRNHPPVRGGSRQPGKYAAPHH